MTHSTCVLGEAVLRVNTGTQPPREMASIELDAANCILASTNPANSMIVMEGATRVEDFRRLLEGWVVSDSFYHDWQIFWTIQSTFSGTTQAFLYEDWKDFWQKTRNVRLPENDPTTLTWANPWGTRSPSSFTVADLQLHSDLDHPNPAVNSSPDGTNAGAALEFLPSPPFHPYGE